MSDKKIKGSCLCGEVAYAAGSLRIFQSCHCSRCRKNSGSAYAANLYGDPKEFTWTKGSEQVGVYVHEHAKHFSTAFCKKCGSALPWKSKNGKVMVIPAGTLDEHPGIEPLQNLYWGSRAPWYKSAADLPKHEGLPVKEK